MKRKIELLVPAKNLECGMAAIDHGADAVYIGAPQFGARVAANNSLEDIAELVSYAHLFNVKVYVTVNVILKDEELAETEEMIWELHRIGVDALIIQDMGILELNLPPIALHSSTQNDNRSVVKAKFLQDAGFRQIVLARELSLNEIRSIHEACPNLLLEVFIHGALCVSYSGQCYVSESCTGRSANRGSCSQFCRLPFDLKDSDDKTILTKKHLLSLKDLNQSERLEELIDAGATSLKIEGRLKDVSYVKNVTAAYRQKLDEIITRRASEYERSSEGEIELFFTPQLDKTFSRGFSNFMLDGRTDNITSFDTPKSLGEEMGRLKEVFRNYITVAGVKPFHNGDGACFVDESGRLQGFRINRVDGNKLYPQEMPNIKPKTIIYRNYDQEFEKLLSKTSSVRTVGINMVLSETDSGFKLSISDRLGNASSSFVEFKKELARSPQHDNIINQLSKLGGTMFRANKVEVNLSDNWFIPSSLLAAMRREAVELLLEQIKTNYKLEHQVFKPTSHEFPVKQLTYLGNVMNEKATKFYARHGVTVVEPAFELSHQKDVVLMVCKHCIRYSMGWCPTYQKKKSPYKEPYYLVAPDGEYFKLTFDCKNCVMNVLHR